MKDGGGTVRGASEGDGGPRPLRPLQAPRSLSEDAADLIREGILSGGFRQGEHLVEARIAQQLNVSRGPVREAFKLLSAEGLVDEKPRRGTFVVSFNTEDVREIYDLRAGVEAQAARLLARSRSESDLRQLRDLIRRVEAAAAKGDTRAISRNDLDFHEAVCRLTGNRRLHEVFRRYVPMLRTLLKLDEHLYSTLGEIAHQHTLLLRPLEDGDPELAAIRFREHCASAKELVIAYIDALPDQ